MYRCHKPNPTCQQMFHVKENTEGGCTAATSPTPPVSRCSMSKKTEWEDVPLPHAQPNLSVDVQCQRKHRGKMYRCHKPHPTCQQMFHVKENTEVGNTAATSPNPPVSRCSMSKKTQREDVPLPQAQPHLSVDVSCQIKHRGRMYRSHKPRPTCQHMFHVKENTEGGCTGATSPAPPVSRCSMSKKTEREDVPLPQAQPHLSVDVPCQRKHKGRMYRCHKPHPTCQQMFHFKENTEGRCTAATSPTPPVSRCSMSKKTEWEDVPLPQAQPHLSLIFHVK